MLIVDVAINDDGDDMMIDDTFSISGSGEAQILEF